MTATQSFGHAFGFYVLFRLYNEVRFLNMMIKLFPSPGY